MKLGWKIIYCQTEQEKRLRALNIKLGAFLMQGKRGYNMKFRCKKTLTMGRFQIFEEAEARLKHIAWNIAPELSIFTLFFKADGFT